MTAFLCSTGRLPFQYKTLYEYQQEDPRILTLPNTQPDKYQMENLGGYELVCQYQGQHNHICLIQFPPEMVENWWRYGGEFVTK